VEEQDAVIAMLEEMQKNRRSEQRSVVCGTHVLNTLFADASWKRLVLE
jgi:hypothetical protein